MNRKTITGIFIALAVSTTTVIADDDVAALVVDNGTPIAVPEPSTLALLMAGAVGAGIVAYRNRKK